MFNLNSVICNHGLLGLGYVRLQLLKNAGIMIRSLHRHSYGKKNMYNDYNV